MEFDATRPLNYLPDEISEFYIEQAKGLLFELNSKRLEVTLIPAPFSTYNRKIRNAEDTNPEWYRKLYHKYAFKRTYTHSKTNRKRVYLDSLIKRENTTNSLKRIIEKRDKFADISSRYRADFVYRNFIHDFLINGDFDYELGIDIPAENRVREFFGLKPLEDNFEVKERIPF